MSTDQSFHQKWIEGICAVEIHDGVSVQYALGRRIETYWIDERMAIEQEQSVI
jgi:hypothetical protein